MIKKVALIFGILALFFGCDLANLIDNESDLIRNPDTNNIPSGFISVGVASSKGIDLTLAEAETDVYEVLIYNASYFLTGAVDVLSGTVLSVPVGTFKVVVLAGRSYLDTSLLASGTVENVEVFQDETTQVAVHIVSPVTSVFTAPTEVICGRDYDVTLSGDTGDSILRFPSSFIITEEISSSTDLLYPTVSVTGQTFSATMTLTAPLSPNVALYELNPLTHYLNLIDTTFGVSLSLDTTNTIYGWMWLSTYCTASSEHDTSLLDEEFQRTVAFIADPTGMSVDIIWGP